MQFFFHYSYEILQKVQFGGKIALIKKFLDKIKKVFRNFFEGSSTEKSREGDKENF